jgi:hypothetical protein
LGRVWGGTHRWSSNNLTHRERCVRRSAACEGGQGARAAMAVRRVAHKSCTMMHSPHCSARPASATGSGPGAVLHWAKPADLTRNTYPPRRSPRRTLEKIQISGTGCEPLARTDNWHTTRRRTGRAVPEGQAWPGPGGQAPTDIATGASIGGRWVVLGAGPGPGPGASLAFGTPTRALLPRNRTFLLRLLPGIGPGSMKPALRGLRQV